MKAQDEGITAISTAELPASASSTDERAPVATKTLLQKFRGVIWDTLDKSPIERRFLAKLDVYILTWAGFTYFSKNLNTNNVCKYSPKKGPSPKPILLYTSRLITPAANAYVSGMKEELNVIGNECVLNLMLPHDSCCER